MKKLCHSASLFFLCLMIGAAVGAFCHFEFNWDFLNYHFYNPWAFLNGRLNYDVVPASVNTFFNPLPDLPLYFLIRNFNHFPAFIYGVQGLWFGVLLFVFIKLSRLLFYRDTKTDYAKTILAAALASTGQATFFQIGASTNEIPVAAFAMTSFYFLIKWILNGDLQNWKKFLFLGIFFGIGLGLKPTIISYCIASGIGLILMHRHLKRPALFVSAYFFGGIFGYLISNGYFMFRYWELYQNPFFPFLNGVFRSEWFDAFNYTDDRFRPTAANFLYYPLLWFRRPAMISETLGYDYRFPIFYVLLLFSVLKAKALKTAELRWKAYWIFALLCFFAWYFLFCILRYAVILEMLAAIPISAAAVNAFMKIEERGVSVILRCSFWGILCGIFLITPVHAVPWSRNDAERYVDIEIPAELPEKFLLKLYGFPTAGIIPVWAEKHELRALGYRHFNALYMKGSDFVDRGRFRKMRDAAERENKAPVVLVHRVPMGKNGAKVLAEVDLSGFSCRLLKNNLDPLLKVCFPEK